MSLFTAIEDITNEYTYTTGLALYREGSIKKYKQTNMLSFDAVTCTAVISSAKAYHMYFKYDFITNGFIDYTCSCGETDVHNGPCKHLVAAMMAYLSGDQGKPEVRTMKRRYSRRTSFGLEDLLHVKSKTPLKPYLQDLTQEGVKIRVAIQSVADYGVFAFKIGVKRMYILKDIFQFRDCVRHQIYYSYGKNLGFVHDLQAFDPDSQQLVEFICLYADVLEGHYRYIGDMRKNPPMHPAYLVKMVEMTGMTEIPVTLKRTEKNFMISHEIYRPKLSMSASEEGLELTLEKVLRIDSQDYMIYFLKDKLHIVDKNQIEEVLEFQALIENDYERTLFVSHVDLPAFCKTLLPKLETCFRLEKNGFEEEGFLVEDPNFSIYLDAPDQQTVTASIFVEYDQNRFNLFSDDSLSTRDRSSEMMMNKLMSEYFNAFDSHKLELLIKDDEDRLYKFLTVGMATLRNYGDLFATDRIKNIHVKKQTNISMGVSLNADILDLQVKSEDMSKEDLMEILSNYNAKKKYYRMNNGDFVHVANSELETLHKIKEGLNLNVQDMVEGHVAVPKFRALYVDEQLKDSYNLATDKNKDFKSLIKNMKSIEESDFKVPEDLSPILRDYQKKGYLWMKTLKANGLAGILADDMGLGKTLQVITFLKSEVDCKQKTLIVSPASLVYNWQSEFEKFAPDLPVKLVVGLPNQRAEIVSEAAGGDILITSYDLLKRDISLYQDVEFGYQIIDEAQYIKNHKTHASKAVKSIRAAFKIALTGTPIENRLSELWSLFEYLMPGFLYTYSYFKSTLEGPIVTSKDERAIKQLQHMITPFILRRLKRDVLTDLPDKIEENIVMSLEEDQRKIYDARVYKLLESLKSQSSDEFKSSKLKVLSEITRLRQICCDPGLVYDNYDKQSSKMTRCMDLIEEAVEGQHKVLLFSQFTSNFQQIEAHLDKLGISYFTLTGKTSKIKRIKMVEAFNHDDTSVFLISLKAGGTGLNLATADIVIHFDPWWNVAVENQATDRAHRIGQRNVVNVYKLIAKDTIEEKVIQLQEKKKALADQMLTSESISLAEFSKDDLLEILK